MTRTRLLAVAAGALAVVVIVSACSGNTANERGDSVPAISVNGMGEVRAEPDLATVSTGVEVRAGTVAEARAGAADAAEAVIAALLGQGVDERDIRTVNFFVRPVYDYSDDTPRVTGYVVSNTVRVTVRDVEIIGELIDAVAVAGGDAVRFDGISFDHEDTGPLAQTARELAIADARARAEQLAELTGVTLGEVISVVETSFGAPLVGAPQSERAAMDMAATATSIQLGTSSVIVTVHVTWAIEEGDE